MAPSRTLLDYFARSAEARPDGALFVHGEGSITYGAAASAIARAIDQLRALALAPRSRVLCLAEDTIPLALFMLAAGYAGLIPTAVSPLFSAEYVTAVARQSDAAAVFTTPAFLEQAAALGLPLLCHDGRGPGGIDDHDVPAQSAPAAARLFGAGATDARAAQTLRRLAASVRLADPFVLQPTAGSTGTPKLVLRTFEAFTRYARFVGDELGKLGAEAPLRVLAICSLTHAFAGHMFTTAMRLGAELAVPRRIDTSASLAEVRALDPDVLPMTPRVLAALVRQAPPPGTEPRIFGPRARLVVSAGGKANAQSFERLRAQRVEVLEIYGSSEASVVAVTPLGAWRPGCAGVPVADVELRLDADGELLVRSPGLALGYHADPAGRELVGADGFYRTGDIGRIDPAGYLEILGRKRDVFSTPEGSNIYPDRIEILLESVERVEQAIALGDGKSFVTAHLVVRDPPPGAASWIDCAADAALYDQIGQALMALNDRLELVEQIVAFALYRRPFPEAAYRPVAGAKVARDRRAFVAAFAAIADRLYSHELAHDSPMLVPPKQRCFLDRVSRRRRRSA
ncbi:MAG TPA: class I adenylate-forming enzyme family protein [Kofleriaceae bacterium]|jgi:long-subunit acyl-CoA synthetase (AMP-forming)